MRLDQYLCAHLNVESRNKAQQLIKKGAVWVNNKQSDKVSQTIHVYDSVTIDGRLQFVSRGGYKLEAARKHFSISLDKKLCTDVGASTGGFTDCMLQAGAKKVLSIDVGCNQLHYSLRVNPKVYALEQTDVRMLQQPPFLCDFLAADLSFISVSKCLNAITTLMKPNSEAILLIKPQFEAGLLGYKRDYIPLGALRDRVLTHCTDLIIQHPFRISGRMPSPIPGAKKGNIEELFYLERL